jgi:hypothetical protein
MPPNDQIGAQLKECQEIAKRLQDELRSATRILAIVEAFNGRDENHRLEQHAAISSLGLNSTANVLIKGLVRDTLSSLLRISDPSGAKGQRHTFCRLREFLDDQGLVLALEDNARNWQPDWDREWQEQNVELVRKNIRFIMGLVPSDWTHLDPPDLRLKDIRELLRLLRNSILAHAENYEQVQQPALGQIRDFLKLAAELQAASSLVFLGASDDLQQRWDAFLREANDFWDLMNFCEVQMRN